MADDALTRKEAEMGRLREIAAKMLADYKEHYDFPWQGESHMEDCIVTNLRALSLESVREEALAYRLEAMLHQVGHPDYSLKEFYEGIKLIVWELRQVRTGQPEGMVLVPMEPTPAMIEASGCGSSYKQTCANWYRAMLAAASS